MGMEFPKGGLIGKSLALWRRVRDMEISSHAAHAGYFIVLAIFPMLVLILSILRYTSLDAQDLLALISAYIPRALEPAVEKLVIQTYAYSGAAMVSVSAVGALWSASRGVWGVVKGLNAIYDVPEDRGWLRARSISMLYTIAFLIVLLLSLGLNLFGEQILRLLPDGRLWRFVSNVVNFRFLVMLAVETALFAAMFTVLPNRPNAFRRSLPGAVVAALGWLFFTDLFSIYVEYFSAYSNIYGSVYAVALGMLWLYCCLSILFFGAAVNRLMEES